MDDLLSVYIPIDRRQALARGEFLPDRTKGSILFADISGFTSLTEILAKDLGRKRGVDELTRQLNLVYEALITEVHRYRGSVINFSGDAITCWFDGDDGRRATTCALTLQRVLDQFARIETPSGKQVPLAIKVAVTNGSVRRFQVGDPQIQYLDVLAGALLDRMAEAEQQTERGEVVVGSEIIAKLGDKVEVLEWRQGVETGQSYAVVTGLADNVEANPWPPLPTCKGRTAEGILTEADVRAWLLPPVYERSSAGQGLFLAELRQVVALFLRFGGLDFDQDDAAGVKLDAYIRLVQNILRCYGGYLIQLTFGDKGCYLYATFGAPLAHEDAPTQAVAAALELQSPPTELGLASEVQVGISRGQMRAGAYGSKARRTYGVLGDEVNLAARLMSQAKPGQILVSKHIADAAAKSYQFKYLGVVEAKGKQAPVPIFLTLGRRLPSGPRMSAAFTNPLVGREDELVYLEQVLEAALAGQGQVIRVEGAAGIGKSHLAAEFVGQSVDRGFQVSLGICQSISQSVPYYPWRQVFRALFGLSDEPVVGRSRTIMNARQIAQVNAIVDQTNPDWHLLLPLLGDLLDLPIPDNATTEAFDPRLRQGALFALSMEIVQSWAQAQPLLLLVEDAHWMDEASRMLTLALARSIAQSPVVLALIHRPSIQAGQSSLSDLNRLPYYHYLELGELSSPGVAALVANLLQGQPSALSMSLIQAKAQGNPFFAEELADALRQSGGLYLRQSDSTWALSEELFNALRNANCLSRENGHWQLRNNAPLATVDLGLPDSIQGLVLARIDRLLEPDRLTLKVASVIGRSFGFELLVQTHPTQPGQEILTEQMKVLENSGLIRQEMPPPQLTYSFKHHIVQEVAYEMLLFAQRRQLHRVIAQWYETILAGDRDDRSESKKVPATLYRYLPVIVHHYHRAEDVDRERYYAKLAGEQAAAKFANAEAINYLSRALDLTPETDYAERYALLLAREKVYNLHGERQAQRQDLATLQQVAEVLADDKRRAEISLRQTNYAAVTGDYPAAITAVRTAIDLAKRSQAVNMEAAGYLQWGWTLWSEGDYHAARSQLERGLALARSAQLRHIEADSLRYLGVLFLRQCDYAQAKVYFEQALYIHREIGHRHGEGIVLNNLGALSLALSDYTAARIYYERALRIRREIGHRHGEGIVLNNLGEVCLRLGDYVGARRYYEQSLRVCREIGDRRGEGFALSNLGNLILGLGNYARAKTYLEQALHIHREIGHRQGEGIVLSNLGDVYLHLGNHTEARVLQEQFLEICREMGDRWGEGYALTNLGHALTSLGHLVEAAAIYKQALILRRELDQPHLAIESLAGLARVALADGDLPQAKTQVEEILNYLETNTLDGTDEPFLVYLTCYHVLNASQDHRGARDILNTAYSLLQEQAAKISDRQLRQQFLENVRTHSDIIAAWESGTT